MSRKIIHIDMDAFFASCEQRDHPELRGKPIAVGGGGLRGVVAAASYEARKYGVRSAMPSVTAKRLCPDLIFVKHRFEVYRAVSQQIRAIFHEYTDLVEPLSLDEAYLDITENKKNLNSGTLIAEEIRKKIFKTTQLTASAGVSYCKFLAKIASDINKPNGIKVITPQEAIPFLEKLKIEKFHGIGKVTAKRMHQLRIYTGGDLKQKSEIELVQRFGKAGRHYYKIVRGIDDREVNPNRIRKSIGTERTFSEDLEKWEDLQAKLEPMISSVFEYMQEKVNYGRTINLKIKTADFQTITRSKTFSSEVKDFSIFRQTALELLETNYQEAGKIRLLGIAASNLMRENMGEGGIQLEFDFP
jgi:DNA polymerase-4